MWWKDKEGRPVPDQGGLVEQIEEYAPRQLIQTLDEGLKWEDLLWTDEAVMSVELAGNVQKAFAFEEWALLTVVFEPGSQVFYPPLPSLQSCQLERLHFECRFYRDLPHETDLRIVSVG